MRIGMTLLTKWTLDRVSVEPKEASSVEIADRTKKNTEYGTIPVLTKVAIAMAGRVGKKVWVRVQFYDSDPGKGL